MYFFLCVIGTFVSFFLYIMSNVSVAPFFIHFFFSFPLFYAFTTLPSLVFFRSLCFLSFLSLRSFFFLSDSLYLSLCLPFWLLLLRFPHLSCFPSFSLFLIIFSSQTLFLFLAVCSNLSTVSVYPLVRLLLLLLLHVFLPPKSQWPVAHLPYSGEKFILHSQAYKNRSWWRNGFGLLYLVSRLAVCSA